MIGYGPPGGIGEIGRPTVRSSGPVMIVVNNADSGYVKALQHATYGGRYQSSDLAETNYAKVAEAMGCLGLRVEDPEEDAPAVERGTGCVTPHQMAGPGRKQRMCGNSLM